MADKHLPYYKWYWQDWRANRKVQRMSFIERGLYRELLDECWIEGSIPNDIDELADICGCPTQTMADAWQVLSKCFDIDGGRCTNEKLESMRTDMDKLRIKKSEAGRTGGLAKALKNKDSLADAKHMPSTCHIAEESRAEHKQSRAEKNKEPFVLPDWMNEAAWKDWIEFRKASKNKFTDRARSLCLKELEKLRSQGFDPVEVIEQSIRNGWTALYPVKKPNHPIIPAGKPRAQWEGFDQVDYGETGAIK